MSDLDDLRRVEPELADRLERSGKLDVRDMSTGEMPAAGEQYLVLCPPSSTLVGSKQARCGCCQKAHVWLSPRVQEVMRERPGAIFICAPCMKAVTEKLG